MIASVLLLGAVLTPPLASASLLILRLRKARLGFHWLSAALGVTVSWFFLFGLRFFLPHDLPLANWQPQIFFQVSPALLADGFSWAVGFALVTVGVAVVLTEVSAQGGDIAFGWASSSLLVGLGLFAIFAGNQLTLLLAWAAIDLVELAIWLSRPAQPTLRERVILAFSSRAFAVMLSLWGLGNPWAYVFSIILRWGVFPFHLPYLESPGLRRGLGTIIRLVPPLTTMPLLARLADLAYFSSEGWIAVFLSLMALFAMILWVNSPEALESRPFWIIGTACFAFYAAVLHHPEAVVAWALILAFCGGYLFLIRGRNRFWFLGFSYQVILLLGLPFTPFWDLSRIYHTHWSLVESIFFISHLLMSLGYVRFSLQKPKTPVEGEPWSKAFYQLAFWGMIGTSLIIGYGAWKDLLETALSRPYQISRSWLESFIGLGLMVIGFGIAFLSRWKFFPRLRLTLGWVRLFSMEWVYRILQWVFRQIGRFFYQFEELLEGKGGILWAIVILFVLARFLLFLSGGE